MDDIVQNLESLEKEFRKKLHEVEEKLTNLKDIPKAESLIGKCFKGVDSYNKAWRFYKITSRKDLTVYSESFAIYRNNYTYSTNVSNGYYFFEQNGYPNVMSITEKEYNKEKNKFFKKLQRYFK